MKPRVRVSGTLLASMITVSSLLLLGCSSTPSSKGPSSPSKGTFTTLAVKPGALIPFNLSNNARADVKTVGCKQASGAWVFSGTVKNPTKSATKFQIVVDFVTQKGLTVVSTTVVNISSVSPGQTANWSASGARGKSAITCLMRQAQTS